MSTIRITSENIHVDEKEIESIIIMTNVLLEVWFCISCSS